MNKRGKLLIAAVGLSLFAMNVSAEQLPVQKGENLLFNMPAGWVLRYSQRTPVQMVQQFIPPGQGRQTFSDSLLVQVFYRFNASPTVFLNGIRDRIQKNCSKLKANSPVDRKLNGYDAAAMLIACAREKRSGKGLFVLNRAIAGNDSLYIVGRSWRGKPFGLDGGIPIAAAKYSEWVRFMRTVRVCDTRGTDYPCRGGGGVPGNLP